MFKFISIFNKKKDQEITMARPRTLKLPDGEVSLSGFSPEKADAIQKLLLEGKTEEKSTETHVTTTTTGPLHQITLGLWQDPSTKMYNVVEIHYNPTTKESKVHSIVPGDSVKAIALGMMKLKFFNLGIV